MAENLNTIWRKEGKPYGISYKDFHYNRILKEAVIENETEFKNFSATGDASTMITTTDGSNQSQVTDSNVPPVNVNQSNTPFECNKMNHLLLTGLGVAAGVLIVLIITKNKSNG